MPKVKLSIYAPVQLVHLTDKVTVGKDWVEVSKTDAAKAKKMRRGGKPLFDVSAGTIKDESDKD